MTEQPAVVKPVAEPALERAGEPKPDQSGEGTVEVAAPKKPRRRASRSAKSPAFSVDPAAAPITVQPAAAEPAGQRRTFEPPTVPDAGNGAEHGQAAEVTPVATVASVTVPRARARHKRPRVVAPAGPPPGAGEADVASGEFGS
jgi:ribonuclease E